jgi:hypothetical protein
VHGARQRAVAEIDNRTPNDLATRVDAQPRPAVAEEKAQPIFTRVIVDALFEHARYFLSLHQGLNVSRRDVQQFAEKGRLDNDIAIADFDLHDVILFYAEDGFATR